MAAQSRPKGSLPDGRPLPLADEADSYKRGPVGSESMQLPDSIPDEDRQRLLETTPDPAALEIDPATTAVIVVDMISEFVEDEYELGDAATGRPTARRIARLMDKARASGIRGYYSRPLRGDHPLEAGAWGDTSTVGTQTEEMLQLADELSPSEDDVVVDKFKPSVFFGTQLESMLNYDGVDTLIVTGVSTSGCVRASVVDGFSYNYRVIIPEECVADRSRISHDIGLFDMAMKYGAVVPLSDLLDAL